MGKCFWRVITDKTLVMGFYYVGRMKKSYFRADDIYCMGTVK